MVFFKPVGKEFAVIHVRDQILEYAPESRRFRLRLDDLQPFIDRKARFDDQGQMARKIDPVLERNAIERFFKKSWSRTHE